jgi:hypothetical protein
MLLSQQTPIYGLQARAALHQATLPPINELSVAHDGPLGPGTLSALPSACLPHGRSIACPRRQERLAIIILDLGGVPGGERIGALLIGPSCRQDGLGGVLSTS